MYRLTHYIYNTIYMYYTCIYIIYIYVFVYINQLLCNITSISNCNIYIYYHGRTRTMDQNPSAFLRCAFRTTLRWESPSPDSQGAGEQLGWLQISNKNVVLRVVNHCRAWLMVNYLISNINDG